MKKALSLLLSAIILISSSAFAEAADESTEESPSDFFGNASSWISGAADDAWDWTKGAASDVSKAVSGAVTDAWNWTTGAVTDAWNGVDGFFNPPSTEGNPNIVPEPELPAGTQKMYLGYEVQRTGLNNGYSGSNSIGRDDPHFGLTLGKFYISGFTSAISEDKENFIFLKTVGDNVELHFELVQDIDMLDGDTFVTINSDDGGYDKYFGIPPTFMGRGTLIVRHIDYQNNPGEPQVYTDYLTGKMTGSADTVIELNEEGDYEVALDYEIKEEHYVLGTAVTNSSCRDYRLYFKFSVRNGNCMVFPFDTVTGEELKNTAVTENGFKLDLAYSRYLDINVKLSTLTEGASGVVEDIRFNRPARDGDTYTQEGIYTLTVSNRYTGEQTQKQLYVGSDERLISYINNGYTVEDIIGAMDGN